MLFTPPKLTRSDIATLRRVEKIRREVGASVRGGHTWTGSLARLQRAIQTRSTNAIEGHDVDLADALAIEARMEPAVAGKLDTAALVGYRDAMDYLILLARDEHFTYDLGVLRALHRSMTLPYRDELTKLKLLNRPGHQDPRPGLWRAGGVQVTGTDGAPVYTGPGATEVPALMAELIESLNQPGHESPIVCAAMAHLNLIGIHPWADGSGRMSRALQTLVLARGFDDLAPAWVGVEEWLAGHREAYYAALKERGTTWTPHNDSLPWVRFCLQAHLEQAELILNRMRRERALLDRVSALTVGRPDRVESVLYDAARGLRITNAGYREQCGGEISNHQAAMDLRAMVNAGLLEMHGAGRGARYAAGERLRSAVEG
jgi:Fic family protein